MYLCYHHATARSAPLVKLSAGARSRSELSAHAERPPRLQQKAIRDAEHAVAKNIHCTATHGVNENRARPPTNQRGRRSFPGSTLSSVSANDAARVVLCDSFPTVPADRVRSRVCYSAVFSGFSSAGGACFFVRDKCVGVRVCLKCAVGIHDAQGLSVIKEWPYH